MKTVALRRVLASTGALALVAASSLLAASPASATVTRAATLLTVPPVYTNDATPTFTWAAGASDTTVVHYVYDLHDETRDVYVESGTTYDRTYTAPALSDGHYRFGLGTSEGAGSSGDTATEFTVDTEAPILSVAAPLDGSTVASGFTVTGTVSDSSSGIAQVTVTDSTGGSASDASGSSVFSLPVNLAPGARSVTVVASDRAGNTSTQVISLTVVAPPVTDAPTGLAPTGVSNAPGAPRSWNPVANATSYEARLARNATDLDTATVSAVTCTLDAGVCESAGLSAPERTMYFQVRGVNADGVPGPWSTAQQVRFDRTAPTTAPSITRPVDGSTQTDGDFTVTNTAVSDAGAGATYSYRWSTSSATAGGILSDPSTRQEDGITTRTRDHLGIADGVWYLQASVVDAAGNRSPWSAVTTVTVDSGAPVVGVATPATGYVSKSNAGALVIVDASDDQGLKRLVVRLEDATGVVVKTLIPSSAIAPGSLTVSEQANLPKTLAEGTYTIRATATDLAGNVSESLSTVVIDDTAPTIEVDAPVASSTVSGTLAVAASADDLDGVSSFLVRVRTAAGTNVTTLVNFSTADPHPSGDQSGTWSLDTTALSDGDYVVRVRAVDVAGNVALTDVPFAVDNTSPGAFVLTPCPCQSYSGDVAVRVIAGDVPGSGSGLESITADVYDATGSHVVLNVGELLGIDKDTKRASWRIPAGTLTDADYELHVVVADHAGNSDEEIVPFTIFRALAILTAPADGSSSTDRSPILRWTPAAGADFSRIRISDTSSVGSSNRLDSPNASTIPGRFADSMQFASLSAGTYWWQVRSVDANGNRGAWSDPWSFTVVAPAAPGGGTGSGGTGGAGAGGAGANGGAAADDGEQLATLPLATDAPSDPDEADQPDTEPSTAPTADPEASATTSDGGPIVIWIVAGVLAIIVLGGGVAYLWTRSRRAAP